MNLTLCADDNPVSDLSKSNKPFFWNCFVLYVVDSSFVYVVNNKNNLWE